MTTSRGTHGLRKRCPRCKKLRRFYEPPRDQGGERPSRAGWEKVGGRWTCRFCMEAERQALYADPRVAALIQAGIESARREPLLSLEEVLGDLGIRDPAAKKSRKPADVLGDKVRAFNAENAGIAACSVQAFATRHGTSMRATICSLRLENYEYGLGFSLVCGRGSAAYPCRGHLADHEVRVLQNEAQLASFLDEAFSTKDVRRVVTLLGRVARR